jgi:pimeloyl-ACP methyl ester carboxylesterase
MLQSLNIDKAMIVGHSMGGMLAARFSTQYPAMTERLVLYNPIGLVDPRFDRPWESADDCRTWRRRTGPIRRSWHFSRRAHDEALGGSLRAPSGGSVACGSLRAPSEPWLLGGRDGDDAKRASASGLDLGGAAMTMAPTGGS